MPDRDKPVLSVEQLALNSMPGIRLVCSNDMKRLVAAARRSALGDRVLVMDDLSSTQPGDLLGLPFRKEDSMEAEKIVFGAKPYNEGQDPAEVQQWQLIFDPVEFALAEGTIGGASKEEIRQRAEELAGSAGLVSQFETTSYSHTVCRRSFMRLLDGVDPIVAAEAFPGKKIHWNPEEVLPAPEGALVQPELDYGWGYTRWVHGDIAYESRSFNSGRHEAWIVCDEDEARMMRVSIKEMIKSQKDAERRKRREHTYMTLPHGKAGKAYGLSMDLWPYAVLGTLKGVKAYIKSERPLKKLKRAELLKNCLAFLRAAEQLRPGILDDPKAEDVRKELEQIFTPLREKWDVCKTKRDAKHCVPIMEILWPGEDFPLPGKES